MKLLSPAKVNLFLRVLRKRKDGYHEIETLFERINLCDEIILKPAAKGIHVHCSSGPQGPANLAYQAAKILQDEFKINQGIEITIRKRIPIAAGLGGGSSNAATVLLGLNRFWKLRCSKKKLMELGARLGSDVPFFILETPFAMGKGRGEKVKKVDVGARFIAPANKIWHCLVKPKFKISTKKAYQAFDMRRGRPRSAPTGLTFQRGDVRMSLFNSLETVLNKRLIEIISIKKSLMERGAIGSLMSGSGSTVFGIFSSKGLAQKAARQLRKKNGDCQVFVASTF